MSTEVVYDFPTTLDALAIRRRLGAADWSPPGRLGPDGWYFQNRHHDGSIIVSVAPHGDVEWVHASIAWRQHMPTYDDLKLLHAAVFPTGWAYQVFTPPSEHVNIHEYALHLWGRLDGERGLPDFTEGMGSI